MDFRKVIRGIGKVLISVGALLFLFVAYQLWGTDISQRREQSALKAEFEQRLLLTAPPTLPLPTGGPAPVAAPGPTGAPQPPPDLGEGVALISIPKIGVEQIVVEGTGVEELKRGPGHYSDTPMPGEKGNAAIAGHRTTYGRPFYDLNDLEVGDPIFVTTLAGRFRYDVMEQMVVSPNDRWVLDPTPDNRLTLTTCNPRFSAAERLILVAGLATPVVVSAAPEAPSGGLPESTTATTLPPRRSVEAAGLSGDGAPRTPAIVWGSIAAGVWLTAWFLARSRRKWAVYAMVAPAFLFALFYFFENVATFLPANV